MNKFYIYMLRRVLAVLFLTVGVLVFISIVIDVFDKMSLFVNNKTGLDVIARYYIFKVPGMLRYMVPVGVIFSGSAVFHAFSFNRELISIYNSGKSYWYVTKPILITGFIVGLFMFLNNEYIVPEASTQAKKIEYSIKQREYDTVGNRYNFSHVGSDGALYNIRYYDAQNKVFQGFLMERWDGTTLMRRVEAGIVRWNNGWFLEDYSDRVYEHGIEKKELSKYLESGPTRIDIIDSPSSFSRTTLTFDEMSARAIRAYVAERKKSGYDVQEYLVEMNMKISFPFISFLVALVGVGIILRWPRLKTGNILGISIGVSFVMWGVYATSRSLGIVGVLSPFLSTFLPFILLLVIGVFMVYPYFRKY